MKNKNNFFINFSIGFFLIILLFSIYQGYFVFMRQMYPLKYADFVEQYSAQYGLPEEFVYAVIHCESGFRPDAYRNDTESSGLMQLLPGTFDWLQTKTGEQLPERDIFDPQTNIRYGCLYLSMNLESYGSLELAAAAYHAGGGNVDKWLADGEYSKDGVTLEHIPFGDTGRYVEKVMKTCKIYKNLYF